MGDGFKEERFKSEKVWWELKRVVGWESDQNQKKKTPPQKGVSLRQRRDDRLARSRPGTVTPPRWLAGRQAGKSH